ncbi:hypothetical protein CDAR_518051 [Caerostris darwini]|uniref:Uncharacterized protein n=1 Tax=Caerostris darwini TaxID=1538125 RepID=A0AAV4SQC8_9ARAC|nr:hypothetical protein CDAR_518051 [Caerostris darwini]
MVTPSELPPHPPWSASLRVCPRKRVTSEGRALPGSIGKTPGISLGAGGHRPSISPDTGKKILLSLCCLPRGRGFSTNLSSGFRTRIFLV